MNTFFISDLHFGHRNSLVFTRDDGSLLRPFDNVDEMNEVIIQNINSKVSPKDNLWILGDATMPKSAIHHIGRLNGKKRLVLGNHDHAPQAYEGVIDTVIRAYAEFDGNILSHIPLHTSQLDARWKRNIHGHLHAHHVLINGVRDVRYYNVSVDCYSHGTAGTKEYHSGMNFFPKSYEEIKAELAL